jgi:septal ring factor EnvC (AmiA/AmiB activator)
MSPRRRTAQLRLATAASAALALLSLAAVAPITSSADPSLNELNSELGRQQDKQQSLTGSIDAISRLIGSLGGQIAFVRTRETAVRAELARDRNALAAAHAALVREQRLLVRLRARLARARMLLARQLVSSYEGDRPDLVSVVLDSHGFRDLLDQITYLHDAERQQRAIIDVTREAKAQADGAARRLGSLERSDRGITARAALRARALAGMDALLQSRVEAEQRARAAQQAALDASRARGAALQAEIANVQAQQAAAAQAAASASVGTAAGASGGWAIPYAIVLCESGGQNLPPNSAGASGYYQILPSTWKLFGGSGPAAYLAGKAEQDAVAARIWNGGAGASNWVCAGILGIR